MEWSILDAVLGARSADEIAMFVRVVFEAAPNNLPSSLSQWVWLGWGCELGLAQLLQQALFGAAFGTVHGVVRAR